MICIPAKLSCEECWKCSLFAWIILALSFFKYNLFNQQDHKTYLCWWSWNSSACRSPRPRPPGPGTGSACQRGRPGRRSTCAGRRSWLSAAWSPCAGTLRDSETLQTPPTLQHNTHSGESFTHIIHCYRWLILSVIPASLRPDLSTTSILKNTTILQILRNCPVLKNANPHLKRTTG